MECDESFGEREEAKRVFGMRMKVVCLKNKTTFWLLAHIEESLERYTMADSENEEDEVKLSALFFHF